MKIIIINDYPTNFSFKVYEELPEFTFDCPVRTQILHDKMEELQIESPSHDFSDYCVEAIEPFGGGEEWIIGS